MNEIDKPIYVALGKQLKEARLRKGYSLEYVGDLVGKSKVSIKRYEDGVMRIDVDTLELICSVLDVKPMKVGLPTDSNIVDRVVLVPKDFEPLPFIPNDMPIPNLADTMFKKFLDLDIDSQKIVLMMLKMDNIDEIMELLKE